MERILVEASGAGLTAACFLFDHQTNPPRPAKRTTAMRSPFGFMGYLRFHHVPRPKPTTASGKITTLSQNSMLSLCDVMLSGWSAAAFGRMEMRSSSELSQLTMLPNKSALARRRDPRRLFSAHAEGPSTTKRPEGVTYFLKAAVPAAGKAGVRLALHPNDPPAPISRGSGQIMGSVAGWKHLIEIVDSPANGITFDCGVTREMGDDPVAVAQYFASRKRINHVHYRNVAVVKPYEKYRSEEHTTEL